MNLFSLNKQVMFSILLLGGMTLFSCTKKEKSISIDWPEITSEAKPWTRWWWHGSAVTKEGITAELESFKQAGLGGVEITPIFGIKGEEDKFIDFLTDEWMDMLIHTLVEADRLGLGVDMATGTGWPFGGPWITDEEAPKNVVYETYELKEGQSLQEQISFTQPAMIRAVGKTITADQVKYPISSNKNLQELALDQVKFEKQLPLIALMAYDEDGNVLNLTDQVVDGKLDWVAPKGNWQLYALFQGLHGKMVERAAPGGEGNVIDHFSKEALQVYLSKFDQALEGKDISSLRAFFNDSYEVDDARGQADWTPKMFEAFQELNGYDLRNYLPALFGKSDEETNNRVLTDYRATIEKLIYENFTKEWKKWGASKGAVIRNQAHGSPANILDLYAEVDIPETEGTEMLKIKFASSAANVNGKKLSSSESATWLKDHFESNLADVRVNLERYLLGGVNHVFYHGTAYSPDDEVWPGWLFYAAIHANDRNPWWDDFPKLNSYITRIQSFMQNSTPDNDLLVYFPVYDRYAEGGHGLLEHFDIRGNFYKSAVKHIGDTLLEKGVMFDLISDRQILNLSAAGENLVSGGNSYKAILIPETEFIPVATMEKLNELAEQGIKVLFQSKLPQDVPGLGNLESRQKLLEEVKDKIKDQAVVAPTLDELLAATKITTESLPQYGLQFNRKVYNGNTLYFITNWSDKAVDQFIPLAKAGKSAYLFDPMNEVKGVAQIKDQSVYLQLGAGESCLLLVADDAFSGEPYPYYSKSSTQKIEGSWQVSFVKGGPQFPATGLIDSLNSWTVFAGKEGEYFSGTAAYEIAFPKPEEAAVAYELDLGEVHESAQIYLNGQYLQTLIGPEFKLIIPSEQLEETNELRIMVSNLMANRIRYMDLNGLEYKRFYNINFPAHDAENRKDGLFHADHWAPKLSGLLGPVSLTTLTNKEF